MILKQQQHHINTGNVMIAMFSAIPEAVQSRHQADAVATTVLLPSPSLASAKQSTLRRAIKSNFKQALKGADDDATAVTTAKRTAK